ncbi:MAG TPA: YbaN family protein [Candidatus Erysipelatoclostridium merdavium]|uniref:YbaN family protein n=1 Tax=Candidatus Erysipelatoclostridium merdavium TaxID=2838566 RepID=A0A9D1XN10_9FIRM|nr:YbaN family protein [Candidatus Erysipelatoclostridium merdavium]
MRYLYFGLGIVFMALGMIGVALPILPTTPFLLVALFFFTKSSKRAKEWFEGTKLYQNHLNDFVTSRKMTLKTKVMLLSFASTMLLIAFLMMNNIYGRITIVLLVIFKYYYFIFRIETIKELRND